MKTRAANQNAEQVITGLIETHSDPSKNWHDLYWILKAPVVNNQFGPTGLKEALFAVFDHNEGEISLIPTSERVDRLIEVCRDIQAVQKAGAEYTWGAEPDADPARFTGGLREIEIASTYLEPDCGDGWLAGLDPVAVAVRGGDSEFLVALLHVDASERAGVCEKALGLPRAKERWELIEAVSTEGFTRFLGYLIDTRNEAVQEAGAEADLARSQVMRSSTFTDFEQDDVFVSVHANVNRDSVTYSVYHGREQESFPDSYYAASGTFSSASDAIDCYLSEVAFLQAQTQEQEHEEVMA